MSQVFSSVTHSPNMQNDPYLTNNPYQQQRRSQQHFMQHQHTTSQPLHATATGPADDAQAEVERLRQRIEQLQAPQGSSWCPQQSPAFMAEHKGLHPNPSLQSKYDSKYLDASLPPEPPPYTPLPTRDTASHAQPSSRSSDDDLSSLLSAPKAPAPDSRTRLSNLERPVAIPATNAKVGSPFLRAYAPIFASYALPREVFLHFIDNLNRVAVANPPLQVLGLASAVVGFVPLATAQIVGNAVSFAAQVGTVAVSKGRTEVYLREANKEIFAPRGLKVDIAKVDAIAKIANIPILDSKGKIDKKSRLLEDLGEFEEQDIHTLSGQERRLAALREWIAPLEFAPLPEIERRDNPLSRLHQAASERQRTKGEKKLIKDREKAHEKISKDGAKAEAEYEKEMRKLEKEERKVMKKESGHKLEKELEKVEKEKQKAGREFEKETGKLLKEDKEEKALRKILWLVIRNLEDDSGVERGIDTF